MNSHWFIESPNYKCDSREVIGANLSKTLNASRQNSVILIGMNPSIANLIRQNLFSLSYHFNKIEIKDAGNIRNTNPEFLIPIIKEFLENGKNMVFLGQDKHQSQNIVHAFNKANEHNRWAIVGESIDSEISALPSSLLKKYAFLGHQIHLIAPQVMDILRMKETKKLSLGEYRSDYTEAEPFLRDLSALFMDINVTKGCELGKYPDTHPSGLTSEEVCQLTRYAGLSEHCNVFSIFSNYESSWSSDTKACKLMAQYIWYYLFGMNERREDRPDISNNMIKYIVQPLDMSTALTFLKSKKSERWWLEMRSDKEASKKLFISVSKKDYEMAKMGNISNRILSAIKAG